MYKSLKSAMVCGIEGHEVEVEVHSSSGLPAITIVGLPDTATSESKDRVRSAICNSGLDYPLKRITVNLAPAHLKKEHAFFDLAIALGILSVSGQLEEALNLNEYIITGELALSGKILPLRGILPIALLARSLGLKLIAPAANINEIKIIDGLEYYVFDNLIDAVKYITNKEYFPPANLTKSHSLASEARLNTPDLKDVIGQSYARRALEIAAAGNHAIMMRGVPGSGKTMLSNCLPQILPPMNFEESLEVSKIYSISGLLKSDRLVDKRAFRAPHHTISEAAMVGGSKIPKPGEVSLAHNGVLFLDEFTEYKKSVLEALRQPLSDGAVTISRASATYTYPARFMLVAACNPCPCGYLGDSRVACCCNGAAVKKYRAKFSGPIVDRIDIQIEVQRVDMKDIKSGKTPESSKTVAARVKAARKIQLKRFGAGKNAAQKESVFANANMSVEQIKEYCRIDSESNSLLQSFVEKYNLSMRSYYKILKVARTVADMQSSSKIRKEDLLEAIQYRGGFNY